MLVYGTQADANPAHSDIGTPLAAYDYRAFGEMIELTPPPTGKVTENFTGKELDDEIALDYFGARYLDPMLGLWTSVDPARQFASPYLYAGNGVNPVNVVDENGNYTISKNEENYFFDYSTKREIYVNKIYDALIPFGSLVVYAAHKNDIENSTRPGKSSAIFSSFVDMIGLLKTFKVLKIAKGVGKTFDYVTKANSIYSLFDHKMNPDFEEYMHDLTCANVPIIGTSLEDLKSKTIWVNSYGQTLYDNKVELTDDVKSTFRDAYYKEFGYEGLDDE